MSEEPHYQKDTTSHDVAALVDDASQELLTSAQNKKLLLKTDLLVLPLIVLTSTLAFLDKNGMAYAAVYGLKTDTNLKGQEYSWLGSIFYFGYLAAEFPTLWLLPKVPLGKYIGFCLFCWGLCLCCMAACHNFGGLATVRFFLGVFEAGILPALMMMNSMWWRRKEQPLRTAFWYNTFAGIFGGILSYAIGKINGSLETWKYIFLIYGAVTMTYGILVFAALPDRPENAWFFSAQEKKAALIRTADNQTEAKEHREWKWAQISEAVRDPKYWCVVVFTIAQSITNAGITNFNPLIISGYGYSQAKTTLMATPQAAVAFVAQVFCTTLAFFVPNTRCVLWTVGTLPALAGSVMIHVLDIQTQRSASLAGVYLMGFYNVAWVLMLSLQSSNTAGETKKSFCSVSVAVFYAVGNIIGPQFFRESQSPHYPLGISAMMCCFAIMAATGVLYGLICVFENHRRDRIYGKPVAALEVPSLSTEAEDRTDFENTNFRYVY
ncbi:Major facilitator superfamily [Botryosphaeria dothidea]|uniref:Major facilitator superfamily n=1 Tax=Botryosphaeria dothidea TaxID=55169 RepID=A0A8H4IHS0_9PEZI|nr:Major facilitator superfamily [Botryosphaeria dothidea]KAF4305805.1 Major facilitator superfamily [Botryosphaeria dothidea]